MKTWLITGVSRGLGKALAEAACARGDTVVGTVREGDPKIASGSGVFHRVTLDLAKKDGTADTVKRAFAVTGRLDVLVNNAGYGLLGALEDATDEDVARLFEVNVFGPARLIRAVLPRLRAQKSGHIINVTSIAGRAPMPGSAAYAATKGALEALSHSLGIEVAPLGIKVTAVAPGGFRTDFLSAHSIRKTAASAETYSEAVGGALAHLDAIAGKQIGDPARAAQAMLQLVDAKDPPLHLLLGPDALKRTREVLAATNREIEAWQAVTTSTDFPA